MKKKLNICAGACIISLIKYCHRVLKPLVKVSLCLKLQLINGVRLTIYASNASQNSSRLQLIKFPNPWILRHIFSIKTQRILADLRQKHTFASYKSYFFELSAPISMAFYKPIFVVTLIFPSSLSSTHVILAARHLLDTSAAPTSDLTLSLIPSNLPMWQTPHLKLTKHDPL